MAADRPSPGGLSAAIVRLAGRIGSGLHSNRRRRVEIDGEIYRERRRRWYARPIILAANVVLAWRRAGVRILDRGAWFEREAHVWRDLYGLDVRLRGRALLTPEIPGVSLDQSLATLADPAVLQAAVRALAALHAAHETHGDATVENVVWNEQTGRACWIDFDIAHQPRFSPIEARADDIRALAASAMRFFEPQDAFVAAQAIVEGYGASFEVERAAHRLRRQAARPSALEIARGGADPTRLRTLGDQLWKLTKRGSAYTAAM